MTENQQTNLNNNLLIWIIAVMAVVIGVMWFFLWKMSSDWTPKVKYDKLSIQVITDERDQTIPYDMILDELKSLPSISDATVVQKDFKETWVSEYLLENNITTLPAFIFSTNNFDTTLDPKISPDWIAMPAITSYLSQLPGGEYLLPIGATYNPFVERSERWFLLLEEWILEDIKENSYTNGNKDAEITWLEFSDFGCAFCVKMHAEDKTPEKVFAEFGDNINSIFMHMPFRNTELPPVLECLAEQWGEEMFNELIKNWFDNRITTKSQALDLVSWRFDQAELDACLNEWRMQNRVNYHMSIGQSVFNVTGTPNNILINNVTWEYEVLSWAYPFEEFKRYIDSLMLNNN